MSVDEFSKRSNAGEHLLFFASLRRQELSALARDLPSVAKYSKLAARGEVNAHVWMGSAGATSTLHYDTAHNSYLQLHGRKRFLLLPPSYTAGMPTYPEAHPSNRQARPPPLLRDPVADVVAQALGDEDHRSQGERVVVTDALLSPGDVLLLPAHWLHYVIALDLSFSVNLWVNSREETTVSQLLAPPHPWPDGLPVASEQLYVQSFLLTLLRGAVPTLGEQARTDAEGSVDIFLSRMLVRKGFGEIGPYAAGCVAPPEVAAKVAASGMSADERRAQCRKIGLPEDCMSEDPWSRKIASRAARAASVFGGEEVELHTTFPPVTLFLSRETRVVHLERLVEIYAKRTVGPGEVGAFVRSCLCTRCGAA